MCVLWTKQKLDVMYIRMLRVMLLTKVVSNLGPALYKAKTSLEAVDIATVVNKH